MVNVDGKFHIIIAKNDSPKQPMRAEDFATLMIGTGEFLKDDKNNPSCPANLIKNKILELSEQDQSKFDYAKLIENRKQMSNMLIYTCGQLKARHLPVYFPDFNYYNDLFKRIMKLPDDQFDKAVKDASIEFYETLDKCVAYNTVNAKKYNIALERPKNMTKT